MPSGIVIALLMRVFVGVWNWAWMPACRAAFERAACPMLGEDSSVENLP